MKNLLKNILEGNDIPSILADVKDNIFKHGGVSMNDMEILSLISLYHPQVIQDDIDEILYYLALYFKDGLTVSTLNAKVFELFKEAIQDSFGKTFTPVQADIYQGISGKHYFSFSAPTSTGKSYVLHSFIKECDHDVVVVVPSRALINEYYIKVCEEIPDKTVNVLTAIEKINTAHSRRTVFIVTPERCRELFKNPDLFNVDVFLFDEAQLSEQTGRRGMYFDSIVRRCKRAYPDAKYVFAQPFVENPEAQFTKNAFEQNEQAKAISYGQRNVGQYFLARDNDGSFVHFGIDRNVMGIRCQSYNGDPIRKIIESNGSVLFYVSKQKILDNRVLHEFRDYIDLCPKLDEAVVRDYIEPLMEYLGGNPSRRARYYSSFLSLLEHGIVIHHGSLPMKARVIVESFTNAGLCRICFATSTLEQGINMPFDAVFLDTLPASKPLEVRNLIGRAGRSTTEKKLDYGCVIINRSSISSFRDILSEHLTLNGESVLDQPIEANDKDKDFKESILDGTFNDEYNLTPRELHNLTEQDAENAISTILDNLFENNNVITATSRYDANGRRWSRLISAVYIFYSAYLQRELSSGEKNTLNTAFKILIWRINELTFKGICQRRFSYVARTKERYLSNWSTLPAHPTQKYNDLPDESLRFIPLFSPETLAKDVDYDTLIYDTYDYIDKLIGFRLTDIFYAAFEKYYQKTNDERAKRAALLTKFGTDNPKYIMMIRYGLPFEDVLSLEGYVERINEQEVVVTEEYHGLDETKRQPLSRFVE